LKVESRENSVEGQQSKVEGRRITEWMCRGKPLNDNKNVKTSGYRVKPGMTSKSTSTGNGDWKLKIGMVKRTNNEITLIRYVRIKIDFKMIIADLQ